MTFTTWIQRRLMPSQSASRPVLFDHLPKCAGTTFSHYLRKNFSRRQTFRIDGYTPLKSIAEFKSFGPEKRRRFRLITGHLAHDLLDVVDPQSINVTVLREPVDRIVSHYFYVKRRPDHQLHESIVRGGITLQDYATSGISSELTNWYTSHFTGLTPEKIQQEPKTALRQALEVITANYHVIGFQDDLLGAAEQLRLTAGLPGKMTPRAKNVTQRPAKDSQLSPTARASIISANRVDIALYQRLKAMSASSTFHASTTNSLPKAA